MTEELFRQDAYLTICDAQIVEVRENGGIVLDRTIFYPTGGGQAGDGGYLECSDGSQIAITNTVKDRESGTILHLPDEDQALGDLVGQSIVCHVDWERRYAHMRLHTALHLLSVVLPYPVTGGQIGDKEARLDFNIPQPDFTKQDLTTALMDLVGADHTVSMQWITDEELGAKPDLVKTMSVQPPRGAGKVRLVAIGDIDLQPCGGTHVQQTFEIGSVEITKIENKGKQNRRVRVRFTEDAV